MSDIVHVSSWQEWPKVSCVMVTRDRHEWAKEAIEYFYAQDYPNRELIIFDSSGMPLYEKDRTTLDGARVRYYRSASQIGSVVLGTQRNNANAIAGGKLIMHWDDDDWHPSWRISFQVTAMQSQSGMQACGSSRVCYVGDGGQHDDEVWMFDYHGKYAWLGPGTLLYEKRLWEANRFPERHAGCEALWLAKLPPGQKLLNVEQSDLPFFLARLHDKNLHPPTLQPPQWRYVGGVSGHQMVMDMLMHRPHRYDNSFSQGLIIH